MTVIDKPQTITPPWHTPDKLVLPGGDRFPDWSVCGCPDSVMQLHRDIPADRVVTVAPTGDERCRLADLQAAIDTVAGWPADQRGMRGVVQLLGGTYVLAGPTGLHVRHSGIVVRGVEQRPDAVRLVCTAAAPTCHALFELHGQPDGRLARDSKNAVAVTDTRCPVGTVRLHVADTTGLAAGDRVRVVRVGNDAWLHAIGMDCIPPRPAAASGAKNNDTPLHNWQAPFSLDYDRVIVAVDAADKSVKLDVALTTAVEERWGGAVLFKHDPPKLERCGLAFMTVECRTDCSQRAFNKKLSCDVAVCQRHIERLVSVDNASQCWVQGVVARGFGHHAWVKRNARYITVADCHFLAPSWRVDGGTRYGFFLTGQLSLVRDCFSEQARHAFVCDARVCGPNVFYRCHSRQDICSSETHHRWASGILYDSCTGDFAVQNRGCMGTGHGISGANCVVWNCSGPVIVQHPPTAWNWAIGSRRSMRVARAAFPQKQPPASAAKLGDCFVWREDFPTHQAPPASLYEYQLAMKK